MTLQIDQMSSPLGELWLAARSEGLVAVSFKPLTGQAGASSQAAEHLAQAKAQLQEYFVGSRQVFTLALSFQGTEFQCCVWRALQSVAYGCTASYGDIASAIQNPRAVRAVGAANGRNPLAIVVPCHRIIGANGTLTGYAGGLDRKRWLLAHEGIRLRQ